MQFQNPSNQSMMSPGPCHMVIPVSDGTVLLRPIPSIKPGFGNMTSGQPSGNSGAPVCISGSVGYSASKVPPLLQPAVVAPHMVTRRPVVTTVGVNSNPRDAANKGSAGMKAIAIGPNPQLLQRGPSPLVFVQSAISSPRNVPVQTLRPQNAQLVHCGQDTVDYFVSEHERVNQEQVSAAVANAALTRNLEPGNITSIQLHQEPVLPFNYTSQKQQSHQITPYLPQQSTQYQQPLQSTQYQQPLQSTQYQQPLQSTQYQPPLQSTQYQPPLQSTQYQSQQSNQYKPPTSTQYQPQPSTQYQPQPSTQLQPSTQYQSQPSTQYQSQATTQYQPQTTNQYQPQTTNQCQPQPTAQYQSQPSYGQSQPTLNISQQHSTLYPAQATQYDSNLPQESNVYESQQSTMYESQPLKYSLNEQGSVYESQQSKTLDVVSVNLPAETSEHILSEKIDQYKEAIQAVEDQQAEPLPFDVNDDLNLSGIRNDENVNEPETQHLGMFDKLKQDIINDVQKTEQPVEELDDGNSLTMKKMSVTGSVISTKSAAPAASSKVSPLKKSMSLKAGTAKKSTKGKGAARK